MITRRGFMQVSSAALSAGAFPWASLGQAAGGQAKGTPTGVTERYPAYAPEVIQQIVRVSHFSLDKVKEIVGPHPQLVKAAWDWGFGDWETPLGAASHMGRRDIAEYLLSNGATPSLFSAVMLGDLGMVKQIVEGHAGIERVAGPHSISLLAHARVGGVRELNAWPVRTASACWRTRGLEVPVRRMCMRISRNSAMRIWRTRRR